MKSFCFLIQYQTKNYCEDIYKSDTINSLIDILFDLYANFIKSFKLSLGAIFCL